MSCLRVVSIVLLGCTLIVVCIGGEILSAPRPAVLAEDGPDLRQCAKEAGIVVPRNVRFVPVTHDPDWMRQGHREFAGSSESPPVVPGVRPNDIGESDSTAEGFLGVHWRESALSHTRRYEWTKGESSYDPSVGKYGGSYVWSLEIKLDHSAEFSLQRP